MTKKIMLCIAASMCLLAVAVGAFGAHGLMPLLLDNNRVMTFETANSYHFYHALGLLFLSLFVRVEGASKLLGWAFTLMLFGLLIFSGSLYILSITNVTWFGAITPIGGLLLLLSWGLLIRYAIKC